MEYRKVLIELVNLLSPKSYLELGVKAGYTFNAITPLVEKAYGVDIVLQKTVYLDKHITFFECSTDAFYNQLKGSKDKFDFIFIDADHCKDSVYSDIIIAKKLITPFTGLIFAHDTYPIKRELINPGYCNDAWEAAKEVKNDCSNLELEIVTLPGPWAGLSIMRYTPNNYHGWMDS